MSKLWKQDFQTAYSSNHWQPLTTTDVSGYIFIHPIICCRGLTSCTRKIPWTFWKLQVWQTQWVEDCTKTRCSLAKVAKKSRSVFTMPQPLIWHLGTAYLKNMNSPFDTAHEALCCPSAGWGSKLKQVYPLRSSPWALSIGAWNSATSCQHSVSPPVS